MAVILKCPVCREKFKYDVSDGWPDQCPVCNIDINNKRDDSDVVMPNILSWRTKNTDKVARDVMDGSEKRAELAAEMAGVPVSDMANLKITNLNDRNDAQFSAPDENNAVTQRMAAMQAAGMPTGFGVGTNGAEYAANAHAPVMINDKPQMVEPYAGARARKRLQSVLNPIGQAPLPNEIVNNPTYRPRA
jgi:hypothetical protein